MNTKDKLILRLGGLPSSNFPTPFCLWDALDPKPYVKENFNLVECRAIVTKIVKIKGGNTNMTRDISFPSVGTQVWDKCNNTHKVLEQNSALSR